MLAWEKPALLEKQQAAAAASKDSAALVPAAAAQAPAAPGTPAATPAAKAPTWQGSVGLGLIALSGNASNLTVNGTATFERKDAEWIMAGRAFGTYGQSRISAEGAPETLALNAGIQARGDRRFNEIVSGFLLGGAETDHVKSVEARLLGEAGLGLIWADVKEGAWQRTFFRTDLAFRASQENRFQYFPTRANVEDLLLLAPRLGVTFQHALSKDVVFREEVEFLPNVIGSERLVANSVTKLTTRLVDQFSLGVSLLAQYDSSPAPGKVPLDTALTIGVELGL